MCQAFSCIVDIEKKVTWRFGVDSHTELAKIGGYKDQTADSSLMTFARIEITPDNKSYLAPDNWSLRVDESISPAWLTPQHKEAAFGAHKKWLRKLNTILIHKDIVHPFRIDPPAITKKHIALLKKGASVWASVRDSVWASLGASVWDSVWAYTGSFFKIPRWKYIKHVRGKYPYEPLVKLWNQGLVPSFDGTTWRLHGGKNAKVLFEITKENLTGKREKLGGNSEQRLL